MKNLIITLISLIHFSHLEAQQITIFEDVNFGGGSKNITSNWKATGDQSIWNDKISSIRVPEGTIIVIYEHSNYLGAHKVISRDWQANEEDGVWNDQISAIKILDTEADYSMIYACYLQQGNLDSWDRTSDFTLTSAGVGYLGTSILKNPKVDTVDMALTFARQDQNRADGKIKIEGNEIFGWIQFDGKAKRNLYGYLSDLQPTIVQPVLDQSVLEQKPRQREGQNHSIENTEIMPQVRNYSEGVRVFMNNDFTGESRYVDKDWSFGDINTDPDWSKWWRKVKSIKVPPGWEIICYSGENFQGRSIHLTGDWIPDNHNDWKDDVESIKIVRKGMVSYWGQLLNPGVIVYKNSNFTGPSRYVDKDWSFGDVNFDQDFSEWWRKVASIRVPPGWAIRCYSAENFQGRSIEITSDWVPVNDSNWKEKVESIRIVRRGN
ncbi:MAG: beta/gamma crystallin-related protein [Crocinitomicaceae bacterium]